MGNKASQTAMRTGKRLVAGSLALAAGFALMFGGTTTASALDSGDTVYIGAHIGYSGSGMHAIYNEVPADPANPGTPDAYAYCIEHNFPAKNKLEGTVGDSSTFLGTNLFTQPGISGKVIWVLAHGYPAMSLADFGAAAGVPGISQNDAIEAVQYAVWRYTDLGWDAPWNFETSDSEAAYWYLVNGANAAGGMSQADFETTVTVTAPSAAQSGESLIGPFVIHTNRSVATVTADPSLTITDASGTAIDATNVVDGQEVYLDARGESAAGTATVTATVTGSNATGYVLTTPNTAGGTATAGDHAQTMMLVAPAGAQTSASATATWAAVTPAAAAPTIRTKLLDAADGNHTLPATGGVAVDTISYRGLTPGTEYTVSGRLMQQSDGSRTSITGSTTFTPTKANGTVDVEFTVPAGFAGTKLVAFEALYTGPKATGTAIATHRDINDAAQTISIAKQAGELAETGAGFESLTGLSVIGGLALLGGLVLTMRGRRLSQGRS